MRGPRKDAARHLKFVSPILEALSDAVRSMRPAKSVAVTLHCGRAAAIGSDGSPGPLAMSRTAPASLLRLISETTRDVM